MSFTNSFVVPKYSGKKGRLGAYKSVDMVIRVDVNIRRTRIIFFRMSESVIYSLLPRRRLHGQNGNSIYLYKQSG